MDLITGTILITLRTLEYVFLQLHHPSVFFGVLGEKIKNK